MEKWLLIGAEILKKAASPKVTTGWVTAHKILEPGEHSRQLRRLESVLSNESVGLNLFHVPKLVSSFSSQLVWSQSLLYSFACVMVTLSSVYYLLMDRRGLGNLVSFGNLLKIFRFCPLIYLFTLNPSHCPPPALREGNCNHDISSL